MREDEELFMKRFKNGEKGAMEIIFNNFHKQLCFSASNNFRLPFEVCEDIVANTFYKLFLNRENLKQYDHIKRWLYICVRNECIDHIRNFYKKKALINEITYMSEEAYIQRNTELEMIEQISKLRKFIERLSKNRKRILLAYFVEKKSTGEIAEEMHLSGQTVLNHKTKAIEHLKLMFLNNKVVLYLPRKH